VIAIAGLISQSQDLGSGSQVTVSVGIQLQFTRNISVDD